MFKKLKDKLTEEVKIPSQKFTQSMQQLAQAVVSPVSSSNSTQDTVSNDNFSIDGEFDDTPQSSPVKKVEGGVAYRGGQATPLKNSFDAGSGAGFMPVDLQTDTSTPKMPFSDTLGRLRSSSASSFASDSSFMFPVLESSGPTYNFQSDLESCSEASESVGPNINKEQLLVAYQKITQKYHKYKGRYSDLARHYRDLERDNKNAKHILTECQDKALRRMAELKEQSNLEKQAKAHLEEALRSDLEEKDHLIHTLKTKIKLLRSQVDQIQATSQPDETPLPDASEASEEAPKSSGQEDVDLLTGGDNGPTASAAAVVLTPEPASNLETENALKDKVKKLESLLLKCKEDITNKRENIKLLESDKHAANAKIEALQQQMVTIQKREEEASLSLAKNKQTIHLELESKEDEIKKLKAQLAAFTEKVSELTVELFQVREDSKKELKHSKNEAANLMEELMVELLGQKKIHEDQLALKESEVKANEEKMTEVLKRLEQQDAELNPLLKAKDELEERFKAERSLLNDEISKLKNHLEAVSKSDATMEKLKPILKSVQELHGLHDQLKNDANVIQKDNLLWLQDQSQQIQAKISMMSDFSQEHRRVLAELDEYKKESVNARESLASVSKKFVLLEQTLSTEKGGVELKMSDLETELKRAQEKIIALEESLGFEKSSRKELEEESSKQLALLENELESERSKAKDELDDSKSVELTLKSTVDKLNEKIKQLLEVKAKLTDDCQKEREAANRLQSSSEQLQQQLEMLSQRNGEAINKMTSMTLLLDEKHELIEKLEGTISELEESLHSAVAEKIALEDKWTNQEAELVAQISAIESKYNEANDRIKDIKEKELTTSDKNNAQINSIQNENEKLRNEIVDLKNSFQSLESEAKESSLRNAELLNELKTLNKQCQEQSLAITSLQNTNETLEQSVKKYQSDDTEKTNQILQLEKTRAELETAVTEKTEQSSNIEKLKEKLQTRIEECNALEIKVEETSESCSKLEKLLQTKTSECISLSQEVEKLQLAQSDVSKILQQKTEDCVKLAAEVEKLTLEKSHSSLMLEEKAKEFESIQTKLSSYERGQLDGAEELSSKQEECVKLTKVIDDLKKEKDSMTQLLKERNSEVENITLRFDMVQNELVKQSKVLQDKANEYNDLTSKIDNLAADNERLAQQLKQKISECEDKEGQLDNLADEMKRVEELSQELHRINDDRDANVEVLSSEASSLALKVEELTITTQELKEREVDHVAKLRVAQDLEAEYISMKQREEKLLQKLNEAKAFELERKANEEILSAKSKQIEELEEENKKLKEAGQNLAELINRAKEAEAKCEKLQNDGTGLLLRIQKAEEFEVQCALLQEELSALKLEKAELSQEVETLHAKSVFRENTSDGKSISDLKEPVVEEPCVMKHFADLTENHSGSSDGEDWQKKYNTLLEQHRQAMQENIDTVARLKEENLLSASAKNIKQKERLWDRQESLLSSPDGNSNGSLSLVEKLQQQLAAATNQIKESKKLHRQEVDDLRRILLNHGSSNSHTSSRSDNLEDATELEYLRNILYEYMMGKEPMILARVIAAVVKFDSDQTSKVLQKEQQRLSLLGQLGIS